MQFARIVGAAGMRGAFAWALLASTLAVCSTRTALALEFQVQANGGNCNECVWVLASGAIEPGDTEKLKAFIKRERPPSNMRFNSPGGNLGEALKLGRFLRLQRWDTFVGEESVLVPGGGLDTRDQESICYSACVYAFAGGVHRKAEENAIGVHQFDKELRSDERASSAEGRDTDISAAQGLVAVLNAFVEEMGVSTELVTLASLVPPAEIYQLSRSELLSFKLDNTSAEPAAGAAWDVVPAQDGALAITMQKQNGAGRVASLAVGCRAADPTIVYVTVRVEDETKPTLSDELKGLMPEEVFAELDGKSVRIEASRVVGPFRPSGRGAAMMIVVTREEVSTLASAKRLRLYGDSGAALWRAYGELGGAFSMEGAADAIRLALKTCPSS